MSRKLTIKTKNVNSQPLYKEINEFIETGLTTSGIRWGKKEHRESFGEVVEDWLDEFMYDGKITQYKVISDDRINPHTQDEDIFNVMVSYKQRHCLNVTQIDYKLVDEDDTDEDILAWLATP